MTKALSQSDFRAIRRVVFPNAHSANAVDSPIVPESRHLAQK